MYALGISPAIASSGREQAPLGGFVTQETCEAAACKWNPSASKLKCGAILKSFCLPANEEKNGNEPSGAFSARASLGYEVVSIAVAVLWASA